MRSCELRYLNNSRVEHSSYSAKKPLATAPLIVYPFYSFMMSTVGYSKLQYGQRGNDNHFALNTAFRATC
jgi:hypothetical protein